MAGVRTDLTCVVYGDSWEEVAWKTLCAGGQRVEGSQDKKQDSADVVQRWQVRINGTRQATSESSGVIEE